MRGQLGRKGTNHSESYKTCRLCPFPFLTSLHSYYFHRKRVTCRNEKNHLAPWIERFLWIRRQFQRAQVAMAACSEERMGGHLRAGRPGSSSRAEETAAGKVVGRHQRETPSPCLWPALQGHWHLCPGHNGICIFKQARLCEDKCIPSPVINPSHRPCSTNQVSGAPSLLCHPPHTPTHIQGSAR